MKHADSVFEKVELTGQWWLPDNPDYHVPGALSGTVADGFYLRLPKSLDPEQPFIEPWGQENSTYGAPALIHGQTFDGRITLQDTFRTSRNVTSSGLQDIRYYANRVLKGVHVTPSDELRFSKMYCSFSILCDWINPRGFKTDDSSGVRKLGIALDFPDAQVVYETDELLIKLSYAIQRPGLASGQTSLIVEWEPQFVIESKADELPWDGPPGACFSDITQGINQLLSVASFTPCYPFNIIGFSSQWQVQIGRERTVTRQVPAELFYQRDFHRPDYDSRSALFPWAKMGDAPQAFFRKWFDLFSSLRGPIALWTDSIAQKGSYSAERFLNLVQALEGLHRFAYPEVSQKTPEHVSKVDAILGAVPETHRQWLSEKLQFSHEPSLRQRLKQLVQPFQDTFDWLVGAEGNAASRKSRRGAFIDAFVDSRNALAHALPEPGKRPGQRYLYFAQVAELIAAIFFMKELGIDAEHIDSRIVKDFFTSQFRERLVEFLADELQ